jgi:hypothetical protein
MVQLVRQTFAPVLQLNPPTQVALADVWQVPVPLHSRGCTWVAPVLQVPGTQTVPLANSRQAPEPSQVPSVPQVDAACVAHWLATTGGVPADTSEQVPTLPVSAHDWQVPLQSLSQQNPCEQNPELHSAAIPQLTPVCFLPQVVPRHEFGDRQSAVEVPTVQLVLHDATPSQRNGSQRAPRTVPQCPTPSQVRGGVRFAVNVGQDPATHCVPDE